MDEFKIVQDHSPDKMMTRVIIYIPAFYTYNAPDLAPFVQSDHKALTEMFPSTKMFPSTNHYDAKKIVLGLADEFLYNAYDENQIVHILTDQVLDKGGYRGDKQAEKVIVNEIKNHLAPMKPPTTNSNYAQLSQKLPGMKVRVLCPDCNVHGPLWTLVQHLNDGHKWTREAIADWLDELHDSGVVDLEFKVPSDIPPERVRGPESQKLKEGHDKIVLDGKVSVQPLDESEWQGLGYIVDNSITKKEHKKALDFIAESYPLSPSEIYGQWATYSPQTKIIGDIA